MKKIKNLLLAILSFSLCVVQAGGQNVVEPSITRDTILIGDQVEWSALFHLKSGESVKIDPISGYIAPGVELIKGIEYDTISSKKDFLDVVAKATVTSFDSGSYVIPSMYAYISRDGQVSDTLMIREISLEVTTVPIDTATYQMFDIRPQFRYPVTLSEVMPYVVGVLLLAALVYAAILIFKRVKARKVGEQVVRVKEKPWVVALKNLDEIDQKRLWQGGMVKAYYTEVTDVLRIYLQERFSITTMERTSAEILSDISCGNVLEKAEYDRLKEILVTSDFVKFAKFNPSELQNEQALTSAKKFVNNTQER
ncbi:MAG: hypothetical protein ACI3ZG_01655 [Candidatus Coprenecus sp.]